MANAFIERILERPRSQRIGLWIGSLALIVFLFWHFLYGPLNERGKELEKDVETLRGQVMNEERIVRNLPKFRDEVKALEALRQLALNQLPYKKEMDDLLTSVTSIARESGLEVIRFAPGEEQLKELYAEVPIDITFEGTFTQMMTFFDEISRLSRIVSVSNLNLSDPRGYQEEAEVSVQGTCRLTTYRHLEENESVTAQKKNSTESKRGKNPKGRT